MTYTETKSSVLDKMIPLAGASHAEVAEYRVDVPMRYAEVFARLLDGRIARLLDPRQFLGWCGYDANPSLLFVAEGERFVIGDETDNFIARDGSLLRAERRAVAA